MTEGKDYFPEKIMDTQKRNIKIRKMEAADIPAVVLLEQEAFSEPWSEKSFQDALELDYAIFLVAQISDEKITGYCGLYQASDEGDITNVAVDNTCRRMGIGDALISAMKETALARGVEKIFLEVRESNLPAQKLYEKNGFAVVGMRKHFYRKPDENAILMMAEMK